MGGISGSSTEQKFEMIFCLKEILTKIIVPQKINIIVFVDGAVAQKFWSKHRILYLIKFCIVCGIS